MIELRDITKIFNRGKPNEFEALRGVTLTLEGGRVTALSGPSGSGQVTKLANQVMGIHTIMSYITFDICLPRVNAFRYYFRFNNRWINR